MTKKYIFGAANISVLLLFTLLLFTGMIKINYLPIYKLILTTITIIFLGALIIYSYVCKRVLFYNFGQFISILLNILLIFSVYEFNNTYNYIEDLVANNYTYKDYNVYVLKKNTIYSNIKKLDNKKIGTIDTNSNNVEKTLNNKINATYKSYNDLDSLIYGINHGEIQSFVISNDELNELKTNENDIVNKSRSIYTIKIKSANE